MVDYFTLKLLSAQDPRGKAALLKWLGTASEDQIMYLCDVIMNPPAIVSSDPELAGVLRSVEETLREEGYLK